MILCQCRIYLIATLRVPFCCSAICRLGSSGSHGKDDATHRQQRSHLPSPGRDGHVHIRSKHQALDSGAAGEMSTPRSHDEDTCSERNQGSCHCRHHWPPPRLFQLPAEGVDETRQVASVRDCWTLPDLPTDRT